MRSSAFHALFFALFASLLQVHAALPGNGTYLISNVRFSTQNINLFNGNNTEGTPIQGHVNADDASKWVLTRRGVRVITLRNVQSGTFINTPDEIDGANVIGSATPGIYEIVEIDPNEYRLTPLNTEASSNLAVYLPASANQTPIVLKQYDVGGLENGDLWKFTSA